ncbi:MAG: SRPBCC domain-containing protein [Oligoflexia bacterium]|nr:SRPBCC domain-containing protein [Oligoflexia bacterium]
MDNSKTIELTKSIKGSAADVFEALKSGLLFKATGINSGNFKHDFREGGSYSLEWNSGGKCFGTYRQIIPNQSITFSWTSADCKGATPEDTTVQVTLIERGGTCELKLIHEGLKPGFSFDDHLSGWTTSIDDFKADLEK